MCFQVEDWEHIVTCKAIGPKKRKFIQELHTKLLKELMPEMDIDIMAMLSDIATYLKGGNQNKIIQ